MAVFLSKLVYAFVLGTVGPLLHSLPVLLVVNPVALVLGSVGVRIFAVAVCFVVFPISVIDVAVGVDEPPSPVRLVIFPVSFVNAAITPYLVASSMLHACLTIPLAIVLGAIRQRLHWLTVLLDTRLVVFVIVAAVLEFRESFPNLKDSSPLLLKLIGVHFYMNSASL